AEIAMTRTLVLAMLAIAFVLAAPALLCAQQRSAKGGHANHETVAAGRAQAHDHEDAQSTAAKPDIDVLIATMNAATGTARVDAIAAVLTALVQKQKDCEAKMAAMKPGMGAHPNASDSSAPAPG